MGAEDPTRSESIEFSQRVRPGDEGLIELFVLGTSGSDWPLALVRNMAQGGANLIEGRVCRFERFADRRLSPEGRWRADLVLDPGSDEGPRDDWGRLLRRVPAMAWTPMEPRLIDYQLSLEQGPRQRLHLEVHAWDALGLLAGVMDRACLAGLQIQELLLETEGDCAFHHLTLVDSAGGPIGRGRWARLDRALAKLAVG